MEDENPPVSNDPRYNTSLFIDPNHNFPAGLLSTEDRDLILGCIPESETGMIAALNTGLPMTAYTLEALCNLRVRHRFVKVRAILEPVICFAVCCAHYYNGRRILSEATTKRREMFWPPDIQRLDIGLRRLYQAARSDENPYDLLETIEEYDLPQGAYENHLRTIYDLLEAVNVDLTATTATLDYKRLGTFNYLFDSPKFLTQQAIETYANNLADITRHNTNRRLVALTVFKRSKDFDDVVNDMMFNLALGNAIVKHQSALVALRKTLLMRLSQLCELAYVAYTQVPDTKEIFAELSRQTFELVTSASSDPPDFGPVIATLLSFMRALMAANIHVCPFYMTAQIFALNSRLYNLQGNLAGYEDELEIESDPSGPYEPLEYLANNPYTDPNLFKCPKNLTGRLGEGMIKSRMVHSLITETTETTTTFDNFELDAVEDLILGGAARHLKISLNQLKHYMEIVPSGTAADAIAMVEEEEEETQNPDADLFANVEIREAPRNRPPRSTRFTNVRGGRPYPVLERRRNANGEVRETFL